MKTMTMTMTKLKTFTLTLIALTLTACANPNAGPSYKEGTVAGTLFAEPEVEAQSLDSRLILGLWELDPVRENGVTAIQRIRFAPDSVTVAVKCTTDSGKFRVVQVQAKANVTADTVEILDNPKATVNEQVSSTETLQCDLQVQETAFNYEIKNGYIFSNGQRMPSRKIGR